MYFPTMAPGRWTVGPASAAALFFALSASSCDNRTISKNDFMA